MSLYADYSQVYFVLKRGENRNEIDDGIEHCLSSVSRKLGGQPEKNRNGFQKLDASLKKTLSYLSFLGLTQSLARSLTRSLTHSLIQSLNH